jgi:EmrB/QacA subfamily drug resistance transporter
MHSTAYKWIVLATVSIANFSAALDMSIIVVSFPRLVDVFNTNASVVVWLAIAFSIAELGLILTLARVGDAIGRKKVYVIGLSLYTLGLIFCSISLNITQLIMSRVVQGAGAAMTMTIGGAIVVAVFPREQQGRAIGIFSMMISAGLIAGPALGGFILDTLDWQGIFYTRIPIGIISLILSVMIIKEQKESDARLQLDIGGAVTLIGGTGCLLLYLNLGNGWGYLSTKGITLAMAAIIIIGLFIYLERRVAQPVLDLRLFKNRIFSMANATNIIQMTAGVTCPTLVPFFLISGLLLTPFTVGILMALIAIPPVILSPISGWLSDKIGNRIPMVVAMSLMSASLFLTSRLGIESSVINIAIVLLLFGTGMGIFMAPNQSAIVGAAPRQNLGTAMGVANTMRLLGSSIGTAGAGTLYTSQQLLNQSKLAEQGVDPTLIERLAVVESFQFILFLAAVLSFTSILTSIFTGEKSSPA